MPQVPARVHVLSSEAMLREQQHQCPPFPTCSKWGRHGNYPSSPSQSLSLAPNIAQHPARLRFTPHISPNPVTIGRRPTRNRTTEVGGHRTGSAPIRLVSVNNPYNLTSIANVIIYVFAGTMRAYRIRKSMNS